MNIVIIIALVLVLALVAGLGALARFKHLSQAFYWRRVVVLAGLVLMGVLAGLLPLNQPDSSQTVSNSDIIFMVDTTYSMNALDGRDGDTRLADIQHDITKLADALGGSRIGIVTYDHNASLYLPLTTTTSDIKNSVQTIFTADYYGARDEPSMAGAFTTVKNYIESVKKNDVTRQRVLVFMTDGELTGKSDTADKVSAAAKALAPLVNAAVVVGYGTSAGGKMPLIVPNFEDLSKLVRKSDQFAEDYSGDTFGPVISHRDEQMLRTLAQNLNGQYVPSQDANLSQTVVNARQSAANAQISAPESQALRQNVLHVPIALAIVAWIFLFEILGLRGLREFVARWKVRR